MDSKSIVGNKLGFSNLVRKSAVDHHDIGNFVYCLTHFYLDESLFMIPNKKLAARGYLIAFPLIFFLASCQRSPEAELDGSDLGRKAFQIVPGTAMPGFSQLSDEVLWAITDFTLSLKTSSSKSD